jgi:hypothetical protein
VTKCLRRNRRAHESDFKARLHTTPQNSGKERKGPIIPLRKALEKMGKSVLSLQNMSRDRGMAVRNRTQVSSPTKSGKQQKKTNRMTSTWWCTQNILRSFRSKKINFNFAHIFSVTFQCEWERKDPLSKEEKKTFLKNYVMDQYT